MVGTGPGSPESVSPRVLGLLRSCDVVVGYKTYIDLISGVVGDKEKISTGMTREIDRCKKAIELAAEGKQVVLVSSGDPGVYGMAGLSLEMLQAEGLLGRLEVEILPGITSATAAAARLGAPLMHDFAVISLSDLLTPWEVIKKRLEAASAGDFVIVLYNPASHKRIEQIKTARRIMLRHKASSTPVGLVRNAEREDESVVITDIDNMLDHLIDMLTVVIVGNSNTRRMGDFLVTPRGYKL